MYLIDNVHVKEIRVKTQMPDIHLRHFLDRVSLHLDYPVSEHLLCEFVCRRCWLAKVHMRVHGARQSLCQC